MSDFKKGDRVRPTPEAIYRGISKMRYGTVVEGQASTRTTPIIWDGTKRRLRFYTTNLRLAEPGK